MEIFIIASETYFELFFRSAYMLMTKRIWPAAICEMLFLTGSPKGPRWNFGFLRFRSLSFAYPQPIRRNRFQKHIFGPVHFRNECRNTRNDNLHITDISACTCMLHVRCHCSLFKPALQTRNNQNLVTWCTSCM